MYCDRGDQVSNDIAVPPPKPPLLYAMTVANLYFTCQSPHAPLLHWLSSAFFTLGLQAAMKQPAVMRLANLPSQQQLKARAGGGGGSKPWASGRWGGPNQGDVCDRDLKAVLQS